MERTMSVDDKIRRAEEIYYRRKECGDRAHENIRISTKKKDIKLFKKMIMQIIICLAIYSVFYIIVNNNYIFSEDFTNKVREILSQDINITEIYSIFLNKINVIKGTTQEKTDNEQQIEEQPNDTNNEAEEQPQEETQIEENLQNNNENIGGAEEILTEQGQNGESTELSQMEQDANYIKSTINFIKPLEGKISSMFGERNPTTSTVPKNHTGTDIAATTGTKIVSATDGTVILASTKGDYGNHLKIQINDVIILYAHCNQLYVKEGDNIVQGQEIAEVGSTGNTTGPHLHFEIRYQDRYVDPQMILEL